MVLYNIPRRNLFCHGKKERQRENHFFMPFIDLSKPFLLVCPCFIQKDLAFLASLNTELVSLVINLKPNLQYFSSFKLMVRRIFSCLCEHYDVTYNAINDNWENTKLILLKVCWTLYFITLKNGKTYIKNLAVLIPQDF